MSNTTYSNGGSGISISRYDPDALVQVTANIGYGNGGYGLRGSAADPITLGCNDWLMNVSGTVGGVDSSLADLTMDPLFCDLASDDVHLRDGSPLLNAPGCGLIGALGVGCADSITTPTLVSLFAAERVDPGVRVRWRLAESVAAPEVSLERADKGSGPWTTILTELSTEGDVVIELDRSASDARGYWYRLTARQNGDTRTLAGPILVGARSITGFRLEQVAPNPARGPVRIQFSLARVAPVELDVFDILGRHVASLARGTWPAGQHVVEWSRQASGDAAPSGLYLVRYRFPGGQQHRRVAWAR
jgi:hypothetical protein